MDRGCSSTSRPLRSGTCPTVAQLGAGEREPSSAPFSCDPGQATALGPSVSSSVKQGCELPRGHWGQPLDVLAACTTRHPAGAGPPPCQAQPRFGRRKFPASQKPCLQQYPGAKAGRNGLWRRLGTGSRGQSKTLAPRRDPGTCLPGPLTGQPRWSGEAACGRSRGSGAQQGRGSGLNAPAGMLRCSRYLPDLSFSLL